MTSRDFCYWLQGYFEIAQAGFHEDQNGNRPAIVLSVIEDAIRKSSASSDGAYLDGPPMEASKPK